MVDTAALGRVGEPFAMDLERGKMREFARATHSANPAYLDEAAPVVPPTFRTTAMFWQHGDADPWAAVAMEQSRGRPAADRCVADRRDHREAGLVREYTVDGESLVDLELSCATQHGTVAVRGWATFAVGTP
jgi:hypothetical protein